MGRRGTGRQERPGGGQRRAAGCPGRVGAVCACEASRWARPHRDWPHRIDGWALTATGRIDAEGLSDPRQRKDRCVRGLQGSRAAEEVGVLRQRARHACEATRQRGPGRWEVPGGVGRTRDDRIAQRADRHGPHAVSGVFRTGRALGRARQTRRWSRAGPLPLPAVRPGPVGRARLWRVPSGPRLQQRRRHPSEAGARVSGRTAATRVRVDGRAPPRHRRTKPGAQGRMLRRDHPPGSSRGEDCRHTQQRWEATSPRPPAGAGGAAQRGPAWLRGVRRGGRGGRKRTVASRGTTGRVPREGCRGGRGARGASSCCTMGGLRVARAVAAAVGEARHPAGLPAAVEALEPVAAHQDPPRPACAWALDTARADAQRARRHSDVAAPAHRVVAGA